MNDLGLIECPMLGVYVALLRKWTLSCLLFLFHAIVHSTVPAVLRQQQRPRQRQQQQQEAAAGRDLLRGRMVGAAAALLAQRSVRRLPPPSIRVLDSFILYTLCGI